MTTARPIPAVSFTTARTGASSKLDALGMRPMQALDQWLQQTEKDRVATTG